MADYSDLSPDDLYKASALAAELHARDVEQNLAEKAEVEAGIPPEYMDRSVAALRREKRTRMLQWRVGILCAIAVAFLTAVVWRQSVVHRHVSITVGAQPLLASVLPAPETTLLSVLPVPKSGIGHLSDPGSVSAMSFLVGLVSSLTFINRTSHAVTVYHLNVGASDLSRRIPAGGQYVQQTTFGAPWLICDDHRRIMGVCFAPDVASTVNIAGPASFEPDSSKGYLASLQPSDTATLSPPAAAAGVSGEPTLVEFVNMTNRPVSLYGSEYRGGGQALAATVSPGGMYDSLTYTGNLWLATDSSQKVLSRFVAGIVPRVAIVWPTHDK